MLAPACRPMQALAAHARDAHLVHGVDVSTRVEEEPDDVQKTVLGRPDQGGVLAHSSCVNGTFVVRFRICTLIHWNLFTPMILSTLAGRACSLQVSVCASVPVSSSLSVSVSVSVSLSVSLSLCLSLCLSHSLDPSLHSFSTRPLRPNRNYAPGHIVVPPSVLLTFLLFIRRARSASSSLRDRAWKYTLGKCARPKGLNQAASL